MLVAHCITVENHYGLWLFTQHCWTYVTPKRKSFAPFSNSAMSCERGQGGTIPDIIRRGFIVILCWIQTGRRFRVCSRSLNCIEKFTHEIELDEYAWQRGRGTCSCKKNWTNINRHLITSDDAVFCGLSSTSIDLRFAAASWKEMKTIRLTCTQTSLKNS